MRWFFLLLAIEYSNSQSTTLFYKHLIIKREPLTMSPKMRFVKEILQLTL